jgi:hypothetical protein
MLAHDRLECLENDHPAGVGVVGPAGPQNYPAALERGFEHGPQNGPRTQLSGRPWALSQVVSPWRPGTGGGPRFRVAFAGVTVPC